ncbi:MAG: nickel pincer cofactor biosynthesis protein LarC [Acidobacteria bacterium]|nr:MAG: nickel pincer cofactor biosynthesis protein LarC [Acidobacteriota bacterium]
MRILYFDTFNGVAGDMILGALLDMGLPLDYLRSELGKLGVSGYELRAAPIVREGLQGTNFQVLVTHRQDDHHHGRHHHSDHHTPRQIEALIQASQLDQTIRERSVNIFRRLGEAEAKAHRTSLDEVHFHEVGAVDAIVDVVGACIGFAYFEIDEFYTAPINLGGGTVTFSHGTWPVPTPATSELVRGFPTLLGTVQSELTTPTGAAIVTTVAKALTFPPAAEYSRWGLGAGDREMPGIPNMLRLMIGETSGISRPNSNTGLEEQAIVVLEATIDDMEAQVFGYFMELALREGALDVYYTPVQMKKNRPAVLLTLLCAPEQEAKMAELLIRETTTLGIRSTTTRRWAVPREITEIRTEHGRVRVKLARWQGQVVNVSLEYEDLKEIAEKTGQPLKSIRRQVLEQMGKAEDYE